MLNKVCYGLTRGYSLTMESLGKGDGGNGWYRVRYSLVNAEGVELFAGKDFQSSPLNNPTGFNAALGLVGFLTLKPGDTDREYFDGYTPEQMAFAEAAAEYCENEWEELLNNQKAEWEASFVDCEK
jgi:hypothetical protein